MRARILLTALLLVMAPAAASAQFNFGVGAGVAIPTGDFGDVYDNGVHVQASLGLGLPLLPDLRLDGIYQRYSSAGDDADILGGSLNILLDLPLVLIKPYLLAGVGYYDLSGAAEFGFTGGAGLRVGVGRLGVFAEARALRITGDAELTTIPVLVGVTF